MNLSESHAIFTELSEAFPHLQRRLNDAPRVLAEWTKALKPLAAQSVSAGISRWIRHHNTDPSLDQFLDLLDTMTEDRRRYAANNRPSSNGDVASIVAETMTQAALGAQNDDDKAWGRLHLLLFVKGLATDAADNPGRRAMQYEAFAEAHPGLAGLALQTAEQWGG